MANVVGNPHDFFSYTSGRWIWDEEEQLRERYRRFDILELQKVAMELESAGSCVSMEKLGEGSYNKSFRLTMANGKAVVARIPNPNAGPAFLTTASEVATMDFVSGFIADHAYFPLLNGHVHNLTPSLVKEHTPPSSPQSSCLEFCSGFYEPCRC